MASLHLYGKLTSTLYSAYKDDVRPVSEITPNLVIKEMDENEGTTQYTRFVLKESIHSRMTIGDKVHDLRSLGVNVFDTRGQIWMNPREGAEINILLQVNSKGTR